MRRLVTLRRFVRVYGILSISLLVKPSSPCARGDYLCQYDSLRENSSETQNTCVQDSFWDDRMGSTA